MWPAELDHFTRPQPFFISAPRSDLGWEVKVKTAATPHSTKTGDQRCLTILRDRNLLERQPGCLSMAFLPTCERVRRLSARFFSSHLFFLLFPQRLPVPQTRPSREGLKVLFRYHSIYRLSNNLKPLPIQGIKWKYRCVEDGYYSRQPHLQKLSSHVIHI